MLPMRSGATSVVEACTLLSDALLKDESVASVMQKNVLDSHWMAQIEHFWCWSGTS